MRLDGTKKRKVRPYDTRCRIFPFVMTDLEEFKNYTKTDVSIPEFVKGLYFKGIIWIRNICSPYTLCHEFGHHIFYSIGNYDGGTRLFFDFINVVYEEICGFIRYKNWRQKGYIWEQVDTIKESWNDFLDWQLCRDIEP